MAIEIIKNILFYISLITGSIMAICLLIAATVRLIGIAIDHIKILGVLREAVDFYIKAKKKERLGEAYKIKEEDIKLAKPEGEKDGDN